MKNLIQNLHRRTPLTLKMLVITVVVGLIVWLVIEQFQTRRLRDIFQRQLAGRLSQQALEDRLSFNRYIKSHYHMVRLLVAQKNFSDYIEKQKWSPKDTIQVKYHRQPPPWFPPRAALQILTNPRYILLLDAQGRVREVYYGGQEDLLLPPSLRQPTPLLLAKSGGRSFLTDIDDNIYLVALEHYSDSQGKLQAMLMLSSPVDDEFLIDSLGSHSIPGHVVALLTSEEKPKILMSSNLVEMPVGMLVDTFGKNYLVTGEEFFDYGGVSDIYIKLASFIAIEEVEPVITSVILVQRRERAITASAFIMTFAVLMAWITGRIQRLTGRVVGFSQNALGVQPEELEKGDQLNVLERRFQRLTENVLNTREALKRETEERVLFEKNIEILQKERQLNLLHAVTEAVGVGVMTKNNGILHAVNKQMENFAQMCGGLSVFDIKDADSLELRVQDKDGNKRVFDISSPEIFKEEKFFLVHDVTLVKTHTEAIEYMALHDPLTGLPNRTLLQDRLQQATLAAQREYRQFALLIMDLNHFKEINDTLGHHVGDLVLKEIGQRLPHVLRKSDTVARWGGDEFAVLLSVADTERAKLTARKLLKVIEQPFVVEGNSVYTEASVGIALYPDHGEDATTLLQRADAAMYGSRQDQSGLSIYNPSGYQPIVHPLALLGELRHAIEHEELLLHYQPKISYKTGDVMGVEALVRWQHPQQGLLLPDEFIPLAENTGLIKPLTQWVLNTALRQCTEWRHKGIEINVSVNLSTRNLLDPQLPKEVAAMLKVWGVAPDKLGLEITESAMMTNPLRAMGILTHLNTIGVCLSIDDFGIGCSSLAYLKKLRVDEIKIDKTFIMDMTVNESDAVIVRSLINLAHNLGLKVIAEGVEHKEASNMLNTFGCDGAQGNYICPPLPPVELTRWISKV